jgi:hypothetical protein
MGRLFALVAVVTLVACGPEDRSSPSALGQGAPPNEVDSGPCIPTGAEVCGGSQDEDCDGTFDCNDEDCYGVDGCPACGELDLVEGEPLALPDGEGGSYETSINITGFAPNQTLDFGEHVLGTCVVMEHSWLRDLEIELTCPSGEKIELQKFLGKDGGELWMGTPNDSDGTNPTPGTGMEYCWTDLATEPAMLTWANQHPNMKRLPAGDYHPFQSYDDLVGCTLDGDWTIKVTDLWAVDNGFIFSWKIKFDPNMVDDCSDWVE